jgi:hypothetical protein
MKRDAQATLQALNSVNLTERQRVRVQYAVRRSEMIVSALLTVANCFGVTPTQQPARES